VAARVSCGRLLCQSLSRPLSGRASGIAMVEGCFSRRPVLLLLSLLLWRGRVGALELVASFSQHGLRGEVRLRPGVAGGVQVCFHYAWTLCICACRWWPTWRSPRAGRARTPPGSTSSRSTTGRRTTATTSTPAGGHWWTWRRSRGRSSSPAPSPSCCR
jgi:hypothetical protein